MTHVHQLEESGEVSLSSDGQFAGREVHSNQVVIHLATMTAPDTHTLTHSLTLTHTHTHTHSLTLTHSHTLTHTHSLTLTHSHALTHSHIHVHRYVRDGKCVDSLRALAGSHEELTVLIPIQNFFCIKPENEANRIVQQDWLAHACTCTCIYHCKVNVQCKVEIATPGNRSMEPGHGLQHDPRPFQNG